MHGIWVYTGKKADAGASVPTNMVLKPSDSLFVCGKMVVTNSCYKNVKLVSRLLDHETHHRGTLCTNRKGNPYEVINVKLRKGDLVAMEKHRGIMLL
jgi:hypothetical protein